MIPTKKRHELVPMHIFMAGRLSKVGRDRGVLGDGHRRRIGRASHRAGPEHHRMRVTVRRGQDADLSAAGPPGEIAGRPARRREVVRMIGLSERGRLQERRACGGGYFCERSFHKPFFVLF